MTDSLRETELRVLGAAIDTILDPGSSYAQYQARRVRGELHVDIAHQYRDPDALLRRFNDAQNAGARMADDLHCSGCGARGSSYCSSCSSRDAREAGR